MVNEDPKMEEELITISDSDDEPMTPTDPNVEMSHEFLEAQMSGLDVKLVARLPMLQDLDDEDAEMANPIRSCLFRPFVKNTDICEGSHDSLTGVIGCVSKFLEYTPYNCYFCKKSGHEKNAFATKSELVDHQEALHDEDMQRHKDSFAYFEVKNDVFERYIKLYITTRSAPTALKAHDLTGILMARRRKGKKWYYFTKEFGYAPYSCILCEERTDRPTSFQVGKVLKHAQAVTTKHLEQYHPMSYRRHPEVSYWFKKDGEIEKIESLFEKYITDSKRMLARTLDECKEPEEGPGGDPDDVEAVVDRSTKDDGFVEEQIGAQQEQIVEPGSDQESDVDDVDVDQYIITMTPGKDDFAGHKDAKVDVPDCKAERTSPDPKEVPRKPPDVKPTHTEVSATPHEPVEDLKVAMETPKKPVKVSKNLVSDRSDCDDSPIQDRLEQVTLSNTSLEAAPVINVQNPSPKVSKKVDKLMLECGICGETHANKIAMSRHFGKNHPENPMMFKRVTKS